MNLNKVILVGRLTRDPEAKSLPNGQQIAKFGLATSRFFNDKNGQRQEQAEFHNITFFGKTADVVAQYLKKGSMVLVEGRLQTGSWQDSEGNKRSRTEIIGEKMQLGPKPSSSSSQSNEGYQKQQDQQKEEIPTIQEDKDEEEIDIKDIPF